MKQYTKNWILAFTVSLLVCVSITLAFMLYLNSQKADTPQTKVQDTQLAQNEDTEDFTDVEDNVGAVSFTEDQVTELARKIFSLDGFLNNVDVELSSDGEINVGAKIKDKEALIEEYPELQKYEVLLGAVENKNIEVSGTLQNHDGKAGYEISGVTVAGMPIDKSIIAPFFEEDDFSELFSVDFDSVEVEDGKLVFKSGVPDILKY